MKINDSADTILKLETNIDDTTPENLGYVMDILLDAGALDVFYTPIYMKKKRPAYMLTVLCREEDAGVLEDIIFSETSTIGIRRQMMERRILPRTFKYIETPVGTIKCKAVTLPGGGERLYPEYEELVRCASEYNMPFPEVKRMAEAIIMEEKQCQN